MSSPSDAVIVAGARLPIGRKGGTLAEFDGVQLGARAIKALIDNPSINALLNDEAITDVIMGNTLSHYGNPARVAALSAGLPVNTPGLTIDRQCGSGINAVTLAGKLVASDGGVYIAGGMESMTNEPFQLSRAKRAYDATPPSFLRRELSTAEIGDPTMGVTAENLAEKYSISREEQDEFALRSQEKYAKAKSQGKYSHFLIPTETSSHGPVEHDEHPRPKTSAEKSAALRPAFISSGTVTAGNASGINDGAAAVCIVSADKAMHHDLAPLARIGESSVVGVDPNYMGIGPVPAIQAILKQTGRNISDYDFIEINEAFASQVLACAKELALDVDNINPLGGAIAHGHPIAATGTVLIQKTITELSERGGGRAIVSACIGGGQGIATEIIVEEK